MIHIQTEHVYPPIPDRTHDWCAYLDGMEEDGNYGWGRTKWAALHDLIDRLEDEEDE